ncbi:HAD family hydrolase [Candidatus Omnitrophota bacterium]
MANTTSLDSVIFDLDGVVTKTALVHAQSWKVMFDEYLKLREERDGLAFKEFTYENDYLVYVDGKPRYKGVQSFLESRDIFIDFGTPEDEPGKETVCGLGNRKNIKFREVLETSGVDVYPSTVSLIKELHEKGVPVGVASSSKNCQFVLQSAGIEDQFLTRVDGVVSAELGLQGKPEGDIFVRAAENLGCDPKRSVVVEDAVSGVQAGVAGGFGLVVGIARENNADELKNAGADVVIEDFEGYDVASLETWFKEK